MIPNLEQALAKATRLLSWTRRCRMPLILSAALIFLVGLWLSADSLDLTWSKLDGYSLLLLVLPCFIGSILNGVELQLCAAAARSRVNLGAAIATANLATIANLLPLPAGAALRGAGIVRGGATLTNTAGVLVMAALMWLTMAIAITTCTLARINLYWLVVSGTAAVATIIIALFIARRSTALLAIGFILVRSVLLALTVIRLWLAFAAVGEPTALSDAAYYIVAGVIGTIIMIAPAGLGVSEAVAAAMAGAAGASPAAAFLALGVNRIAGLALAAILATVALLLKLRRGKQGASYASDR